MKEHQLSGVSTRWQSEASAPAVTGAAGTFKALEHVYFAAAMGLVCEQQGVARPVVRSPHGCRIKRRVTPADRNR